jgi:nucleoside-diphosphate-sugar epimerase
MNWKGKHVLVTGGTGFVGSHLVEALLDKGADISILHLRSENRTRNLSRVADKVNFFTHDISDPTIINELSKLDFDYIFHLAAVSSMHVCEKNTELAFNTNVRGTFNILKLALEMKNLKKIIFPSSATLYGKVPQYIPIDEKHPVRLTENVYSLTKAVGEHMFTGFHKECGLPILIFRFFNIFGPRQTTEYLIPSIISQALEKNSIELWSTKPTRDFIFVSDAVDALIKGAESDFIGGPINIGSGVETNIGELAENIAEKFNVKVSSLDKDVMGATRLCCNNQLAKNILNWEPKVDLEEGLDKTIEWFKNNKKLQIRN